MTDGNEQANEGNGTGNEPNNTTAEDKTNMSIVDEAKKVRGDIKAENDRREKILKEEQKLKAENMLGGTSGGHVEPSQKDKKTAQASEFFKGTALGEAIDKANE